VLYLKAVLAKGNAREDGVERGLGLIEECLAQIERPGGQERADPHSCEGYGAKPGYKKTKPPNRRL
jgi:hypothetical protein